MIPAGHLPASAFLWLLVYVYSLAFFCALSIKSWGSLRVGLAWLPSGLGPVQPPQVHLRATGETHGGADWVLTPGHFLQPSLGSKG